MANKIQKFCLLARQAGEYILYQLSSNFVQMRDGETLQQKVDEIDGSISALNKSVSGINESVGSLGTQCEAVENRLDNVVGHHQHFTVDSKKPVGVSSGTGAVVQTFNLPPGKWLVIININFSSNKTGYRCSGLYTSNSATVSMGRGVMSAQAINGASTCFMYTRFIDRSTATSDRTYYIKAYQNSGSKLNVLSSYTAIRVR